MSSLCHLASEVMIFCFEAERFSCSIDSAGLMARKSLAGSSGSFAGS